MQDAGHCGAPPLIDSWRASTLRPLLAWNLACGGSAALALTLLMAGEPGQRAALAAGWGLFLVLLGVFLAERLPWRIRAVVFLAVNYGVMVVTTADRPTAVGFAHALALVALAGLLLGARSAVGVAILVGATLGGLAVAGAGGWLAPRAPLALRTQWLVSVVGAFPPIVMVVVALRRVLARLEAALDTAVRSLRELEAARSQTEKAELNGQLSRAMAHDLNNTLTVVMANSEWLTERLADRDDVEAASQISEAARNAAALTQYALMASRTGMSQPRPIDLSRVVAVASQALRRLLPPDVAIEKRLPGPVWAHFDPAQIHQVLLGLAFNARAAMPGGGTLVLSVRAGGPAAPRGAPPPPAILEVSDTGLGMDAEERRRAFERSAAGEPATGARFGLSAVKAIVEAGGGEVQVRSRPGAGSVFTVTLPGTAPALPAEPDPQPRRSRVLVVEDDIRVRAAVCTALAEDGHDVSEVADGTQAMRAIEELRRVDLLVTDVVMPGAPIGEVLATFRERHPEGRILVCSAFSDDDALRRRVLAGEYRLLAKPFGRSDLLAEVRSLLGGTESFRDGRNVKAGAA
ncbi:MAG TPA: response regulator [Anaeromyxobacter sp.]|nr:response regulator [Anaeromyxobacter sp.]